MTHVVCDNYDCKWNRDDECMCDGVELENHTSNTGNMICWNFERN